MCYALMLSAVMCQGLWHLPHLSHSFGLGNVTYSEQTVVGTMPGCKDKSWLVRRVDIATELLTTINLNLSGRAVHYNCPILNFRNYCYNLNF
jgi:hypothetical protein